MDDQGLVPDTLRSAIASVKASGRRIKFLYTIPNFHNPAGVTMAVERRPEIVEICPRGRDPDPGGQPLRAARLRGRDLPGAPLAGHRERHLSRVVLQDLRPGFRVGWALAPHAVREKLTLAAEAADLCPAGLLPDDGLPLSDHPAVARADQGLPGHVSGTPRRDSDGAGPELMPAGAAWTKPDGGFYVWVTLPGARLQGDAAPRGDRAGGLRPRNGLLLGRLRRPVRAAVLFTAQPGPDPRGGPPRWPR